MNSPYFDLQVEKGSCFDKVTLTGVLEAESEGVLRNTLDTLLTKSSPHLILDCSTLTFVNSACFGLFFHYHRQCEAQGGRLDLCCLPPKIEGMIELLGLSPILHRHTRLEDALESLNPA